MTDQITYQGDTYEIQINQVPTCVSCMEWLAANDPGASFTAEEVDQGLRQVRILYPVIVDPDECGYDHDDDSAGEYHEAGV